MKLNYSSTLNDVLTFYRKNYATIRSIVASKGLLHPTCWGEANAATKAEVGAIISLAGFNYCKELGSVIRATIECDDRAVTSTTFWQTRIDEACLNLVETGFIA